MLRFDRLEQTGLALAGMSERNDGDCRRGTLDQSRLLARCGIAPETLAAPRQHHGRELWFVGSAHDPPGMNGSRGAATVASESLAGFPTPLADAVLTGLPRQALGVTIADCVPVFLWASDARAAALVHAGRQGTLLELSMHALKALISRFDAHAGNIRAVIGPSAGPCCYEVSEEIAAEFRSRGWPVNRRHIDLWEANRQQLMACGVPRAHIEVTGICTICSGRFFSYRRGDASARNLALMVL